jgi:hypothetical protein
MNTTHSMKTHPFLAVALATFALAVVPTCAATLSSSPAAPAIDGEDIANYSDVSSTDKWWEASGSDSKTKGQTLTTGDSAVRIKGITYHIEDTSAQPIKTYQIRLGRVTRSWNTLLRRSSKTWTPQLPISPEPVLKSQCQS